MEAKFGSCYEALYRESLGEGAEAFWAKWAKEIDWLQEPKMVLDRSKPPF